MDDRERMDRLEQRLESIEAEQRATRRMLASQLDADSTRPGPAPPREPSYERAQSNRSIPDTVRSFTSPHLPRAQGRTGDLESWIGQNALLVIGVLALVLTVGLALKYAFDQGWISPEVRVLGGLLVGAAVAVYGERLLGRGLGRYGAGLVGAGAAIGYTALWAAAGPYKFVPNQVGIGALFVLAVLVFLTSLRHDRQDLALFAAIGAFVAPLVLGTGQAAEILLAYSALVSTAGGLAAWRRQWRMAFAVVVIGFFGMALIAQVGDPTEVWTALYLLAGTAGAILGARTSGWRWTETGVATLGWIPLLIAAGGAGGSWHWLYALGPVGLVALFAFPIDQSSPMDRLIRGQVSQSSRADLRDLWLFAIAVVAWDAVVIAAFGEAQTTTGAWVLGGIGVAWIGWALRSRSPEFLLAGLVTLAVAAWRGLDPSVQPAAWGALGLLAVVFSRGDVLSLARLVAPGLLVLAAFRLPELLATRPDADAAFLGTWPLVACAVFVASLLAAGPAWTEPDSRVERVAGISQRAILWTLAGGMLFFVMTVELDILFRQRGASALASSFAVSAWWIVYAATLLAWGFLRNVKAVRIGGLLVGGLALGKIVFNDLAFLDALYRIGSVALLAGVALFGARAYHQRARRESEEQDESPTAG